MALDSKIPQGPIASKWADYKNKINLVNPANKRNIDVIIVGTGLAGGSAAATLAELGYNVKAFCFQDSPRRAHSIAAQGGINAAKNYQGDGDSVHRLFYDTVKGGDYRGKRGKCSSLSRGICQYYRPVCSTRCTASPRIWWSFGQPFFWWNACFSYFLCKRTNRTTITLRGLFGNEPSNRTVEK